MDASESGRRVRDEDAVVVLDGGGGATADFLARGFVGGGGSPRHRLGSFGASGGAVRRLLVSGCSGWTALQLLLERDVVA